MAGRIRKALARWLDPKLANDAARYRFIRGELDDARWWLGVQHPEAASLAEWVLERDHWWATSKRFQERHRWSPPANVSDINSYREWLKRGGPPKGAAYPRTAPQTARDKSREASK